MHKFFGAVICVCFFGGAGCVSNSPDTVPPAELTPPSSSPTIPSGFSPLTFEEFSTVIPRNWTLDESQRDTNRTIFIFEKLPEGKPSPRSISFTVFPLPSPAPTLGDLLVQSRQELEANGAVIATSEIIPLENYTYLHTDFSLTHHGISYTSAQYTVVGTEHLLLITETTTVSATRGTAPLPEILSFFQIK